MTHPLIKQVERYGYPEPNEIIGYCNQCDGEISTFDDHIKSEPYVIGEIICAVCVRRMKKNDLIWACGWRWG